jgi:PAS domain S-box-containing protein
VSWREARTPSAATRAHDARARWVAARGGVGARGGVWLDRLAGALAIASVAVLASGRVPPAVTLAFGAVMVGMGRVALARAENARLADGRRQAARLAGALETILGTAGVGICGLDRDGRITYANAVAADLAGSSPPDLLGRRLDDLLLPETAGAAGADGPAELQGTLLRPGGGTLPVEYVLTETDDHGIGSGVVVFNDVSERRALERMKSEFVAVTSHELRTPLTSVIGYLEALLDDDEIDGSLTPEHLRLLGVIQRNAERLARLVDDLFVVSQFDSGRMPLGAGELDLGALARECVESAAPAAADHGVALSARVDAVTPVRGDAERLGQVLDNLVGNAVKFTPPGGRVDVRARAVDGRAVIEVRDTGIGIPADEQRALFERFFRASSAVASQVPGTGLGLAIVKMIVEAHGGRVAVESVEGAGSTFRVVLPLAAPAPAGAGASAQAEAGARRAGVRVSTSSLR